MILHELANPVVGLKGQLSGGGQDNGSSPCVEKEDSRSILMRKKEEREEEKEEEEGGGREEEQEEAHQQQQVRTTGTAIGWSTSLTILWSEASGTEHLDDGDEEGQRLAGARFRLSQDVTSSQCGHHRLGLDLGHVVKPHLLDGLLCAGVDIQVRKATRRQEGVRRWSHCKCGSMCVCVSVCA